MTPVSGNANTPVNTPAGAVLRDLDVIIRQEAGLVFAGFDHDMAWQPRLAP